MDKISGFVNPPIPHATPVALKWIFRLIWVFPLFFLLLFPLGFANHGVYMDEAWIGQQAHSLAARGVIVNDLFRDYPPLDGSILIYHKLLIWLGALVTYVMGWGLYQLRLVSLLSGLALLTVLYFFLKSIETRRVAALTCFILLWSPIFWGQMTIFRPEMLMTLLGFVSFMILWEANMRQSMPLVALAGAFAGWSGLAHPLGLFFMVSGAVALISEKEFRLALVLIISALLAFSPYLTGLLVDWRLFVSQLVDNGAMAYKVSFKWWEPIVNILNEHKKIFRGPDIFGLSILLILSLFLTSKKQFREYRFFWLYVGTFFILGAIAPLTKSSRYLLPLAPFFAIAVSRTVNNVSLSKVNGSKFASAIFLGWAGLFLLYGALALAITAFGDRTAPHEIETNRLLASKMKTTMVVMAPFDFVFNQVDNFTIQSWVGCEKAANDKLTPAFVERYAVKHGVEYIIMANPYLEKMHITSDQLASSFRQYTPLFVLPKRDRYLLMRIHRAPEIGR